MYVCVQICIYINNKYIMFRRTYFLYIYIYIHIYQNEIYTYIYIHIEKRFIRRVIEKKGRGNKKKAREKEGRKGER